MFSKSLQLSGSRRKIHYNIFLTKEYNNAIENAGSQTVLGIDMSLNVA